MEQEIFKFNLVNPARNLGGDRYSTMYGSKEWTVYFPQTLTRPEGTPVRTLWVSVSTEELE